MSKRNKIIVSIVGITIVLLALLGITYAYYLTRIEGNTNTNSISITTADLKLVYGDGNGLVTKENIMPGTTIEKTFTVKNTGNNKVDLYAVYLEELVNTLSRTPDLTYVLTCESTGEDCDGGEGEFPTLAGMIITNSIDTGVTHTYTLTVTYKNEENIDQSDDMGSTISAFVQIYALKDIVDIEGSVNGTEEGDFAQINSVQKRSQIVDGKYKFVGVLPGTHTLKVCSKEDTNCTSPKLSQQIEVKTGTTAGVSGNTITTTETSQTATINMNVSTGSIAIDSTIKEMETSIFPKGTLAYAILNNAQNPKDDNSTIFSETPLTTPAVEINGENERTLSITEDDYGDSYYFRGNVIDNYVNFAGMCWRIVRIEGDGSVKLILEDATYECENQSFTGNWSIGSGVYGYDEDNYGNSILNYLNPENTGMSLAFKNYQTTLAKKINSSIGENPTFDQSSNVLVDKLKVGNWCLDDNAYSDTMGTNPITDFTPYYSGQIPFYYGAYTRIYGNKTATLKCNGRVLNDFNDNGESSTPMYIATLTADEVIFAGALSEYNENYYLMNSYSIDRGAGWSTISPSDYQYVLTISFYLGDGDVGGLFANTIGSEGSYRPAVSLKSGSIISAGNGTQKNPYVIAD